MHQPPTHFLFALKTPREENPFDARRRIERDHPFKKTAGQRNNVVQKLFGTWKFVKKKGGGRREARIKERHTKRKRKNERESNGIIETMLRQPQNSALSVSVKSKLLHTCTYITRE